MRNITTLIKPVSGSCNMKCSYCFYHDIMDNREVTNYGAMSLKTLENIVKKTLETAMESCLFGFQGGEPTLAGFTFFKELIRYQKKYNIRDIRIENTIQTNGMLIDEEWAKYFAENNFLVGISIDGTSDIHDKFRLDNNKKGTHKRMMRAAEILKSSGVEYNILSVITAEMAEHPLRTYNFYKKHDFRYLQFIPCIDSSKEEGRKSPALDDKSYGEFLCELFDLWYADFVNGEYYSIRIFDNFIRILAGEEPENCSMSGKCRSYLLIEGDGSTFPCDFYAGDEYLLGNINDNEVMELLLSDKSKQFMHASFEPAYECRQCMYYKLCRGGCRRDRETNNSQLPGLNKYCMAYRMLFEKALPRMKAVANFLFGKNM